MPIVHLETLITAPRETCFDLARSVDVHVVSTARSHERAVAGVTHGLLELGDEVTWEAVHLGVRQRLSVKMTRVERPRIFVDEMTKGAFARFTHTHEFRDVGDSKTLMMDDFDYASPLGFLGVLADKLFLTGYMHRFLTERAQYLKEVAEHL